MCPRGVTLLSAFAAACLLLTCWSPLRRVQAAPVADVAEDTFRCDFNAGMCGMEQEKARDHFDWTRRLNETPSLNTGPACDPLNCVSGYYVYTEASSPRKFGDTARLLTPVLHGEGGRCVTFYWNMNGNGMGNLTVKLHRLDGTEDILWFRTGHQNNTWRLDTVSIARAPRFYRLVFEGSIGISYRSDMAIDNIDVRVGECAVANANCNFTTDLCGWRNTAALLWQRFTGDTGTPNTGPSADRNNSTTGYYLYVESSRTSPHEVARLEFERLSGNVCLQFWYHMFGRSVGTLSLLTRPYTSTTSNNINDNTETRLWEMTGDQGRMWHRHSANLTSAAQHFTVIFEAKMMGGNEGDMAIDDIEVHSGLC